MTKELFIKPIENIDFIVLTETWSTPEIDINMSGYKVSSSHRPKKDAASKPSGDVAVYCKLNVCCKMKFV